MNKFTLTSTLNLTPISCLSVIRLPSGKLLQVVTEPEAGEAGGRSESTILCRSDYNLDMVRHHGRGGLTHLQSILTLTLTLTLIGGGLTHLQSIRSGQRVSHCTLRPEH